jgi:hypothetical protein
VEKKKSGKSWLKDIAIPVMVALITFPVGMAMEAYKNHLAEVEHQKLLNESQCERTANYLDSMAEALRAMNKDFSQGLAPRESGALFNSTLLVFGEEAQSGLGSAKWKMLIDPLKQVANDAQYNIDPLVHEYFQTTDGKDKIAAWTMKAERAIGELRGRAIVLRAHLDSCKI